MLGYWRHLEVLFKFAEVCLVCRWTWFQDVYCHGETSLHSASTSEAPPPKEAYRWKCPRLHAVFSQGLICGMVVLDAKTPVGSRASTTTPPMPLPLPPPPPPSQTDGSPSVLPHLWIKPSASLLLPSWYDLRPLRTAFPSLKPGLTNWLPLMQQLTSNLPPWSVILAVNILADKMETIASRLEKFCELMPSPGMSPSPGRSYVHIHRTPSSKHRSQVYGNDPICVELRATYSPKLCHKAYLFRGKVWRIQLLPFPKLPNIIITNPPFPLVHYLMSHNSALTTLIHLHFRLLSRLRKDQRTILVVSVHGQRKLFCGRLQLYTRGEEKWWGGPCFNWTGEK